MSSESNCQPVRIEHTVACPKNRRITWVSSYHFCFRASIYRYDHRPFFSRDPECATHTAKRYVQMIMESGFRLSAADVKQRDHIPNFERRSKQST